MTFESFKNILDKMLGSLTQIAFGICDAKSNPDFIKMMKYTKEKGIIPNFTTNGIDLTDEFVDKIVNICGAVAVSAYKGKKDLCYNSIKKMTDRGMTQINIHVMISQETLPFVYEVVKDTQTDQRLKKLNAVVFLGLKPKGRAKNSFSVLSYNEFKDLFEFCLKKDIRIGFDSCSAPKFEKAVLEADYLNKEKKDSLVSLSESCESALFSSYINVHGDFFPCSFMEGEKKWKQGISVLKAKDFMEDVWNHSRVIEWRNELISSSVKGCRHCLAFPEIN